MADIVIQDVTTNDMEGTGTFDILMKSVNVHLKNEFDSNRITGSAYAEIYLGAMSATLQQAIAFVLGEQAADKQAELLDAQKENELKRNELLEEQRNKLLAEIALLQQKKVTEEAQVKDVVGGDPITGVIGKQKDLFGKQTEGFQRDAEQKAAKLVIDTWAVRQSTDGGQATVTNKLTDDNIALAVSKLLAGIDVSAV